MKSLKETCKINSQIDATTRLCKPKNIGSSFGAKYREEWVRTDRVGLEPMAKEGVSFIIIGVEMGSCETEAFADVLLISSFSFSQTFKLATLE